MAVPTLNDATCMGEFAQECFEIHRDWQLLTPARRRSKIQDAVRNAIAKVAIPDFTFHFKEMTAGGEMNAQNWRLDIQTKVSDTHDITQQTFLWFCSVLYHEARHGEQWYRCAQGVLAGDFTNTWLTGSNDHLKPTHVAPNMHMPVSVIQHAEARGALSWAQYKAQLPVQAWFDSIWGLNRAHRGTVLGHGAAIFVAGSPENLAYINLPEEVDAYATQHAMDALIAPLLGPMTPVAQADSVHQLRDNHLAAATGPTGLAAQLQAVRLKHVARPEAGGNVAAKKAVHKQAIQSAAAVGTSDAVETGATSRVADLMRAHQALIAQQAKS